MLNLFREVNTLIISEGCKDCSSRLLRHPP